MTIDIIDFKDEQFAALTETQIQEIKAAQLKKDALTTKYAERKRGEKFRLIKNGTYRSRVYTLISQKLDAECESEVAAIREGLLFYLRFSSKTDENEEAGAPYLLDYSLTFQERYEDVLEYYMDKYSDATERFEAFKADTVAPKYMGEFYATMYDYLRKLAA